MLRSIGIATVTLLISGLASCGAAADWVLVTESDAPEALSDNVVRLQADLASLTGKPVAVVDAASLTDGQRATANLIVVGRWASNPLAEQIAKTRGLKRPKIEGPDWARMQAYAVATVDDAENGGEVVFAMGEGVSGAVHAVSHLRTHFRSEKEELSLDGAVPGEGFQAFSPSFEERAVYYNLAFDQLGEQTPLNWDDADWERWIDKIVCCQLTHVYFCLWSDYLCFPDSPETAGDDDRLRHERLQRMIRLAHRRGLKVGYLFAPTTVPQALFKANREELEASIVYTEHGFPVICSAADGEIEMNGRKWRGAWELMTEMYGRQLELLSEADLFQLWFYDPGGCLCGPEKHDCRGHQADRMMQQVEHFFAVAREANPECRFEVSLWPIWAIEADYEIEYRDEFLAKLERFAKSQPGLPLRISDTVSGPGTTLIDASRLGIPSNAFVFPTNVESGCSLLTPMLAFLGDMVAEGREHGVQSIHHMRIEEPMKFANTFTAARLFWDVEMPPEETVREYAGWVANGDKAAADQIERALLRLDHFMSDGADQVDHAAVGAEIETLVGSALASLGDEQAGELEWLRTTARAVAVIGRAIDDPNQQEELSKEFAQLMHDSPTFSTSTTSLSKYIAWVSKGWSAEHF